MDKIFKDVSGVNRIRPLRKEDDVVFFDHETLEPKCSFNACVTKFKLKKYETAMFPKWMHELNPNVGFIFEQHVFVCDECGQEQSNRKARSLTIKNYDQSIACGNTCKLGEWKGHITDPAGSIDERIKMQKSNKRK
jgi:hypothetical protein